MLDRTPADGAEALSRTRAARPGQVMAALDLGTNNCRLLIARQGNSGFQVIDAFSRIVRLGEGVSQSGALSAAAMDRTIEALKVCSAKMQRRSVSLMRSVATEACRRAANGLEFLERTRAETGVDLEIITTSEEAKLAFSGCMPLLDRARPYAIVFDIGGGSTELGWIHLEHGRHPRIIAWHSIPLGVVTLTERFGAEAAPDESAAEFYERMVEEVQDNLAPFAQAIGAHRLIARSQVQLLGTSGHRDHACPASRWAFRATTARWSTARSWSSAMSSASASACRSRIAASAPPTPASAASAPIWWSPAARCCRRSAGNGRSGACASPIAACAKGSS